MEENKDIDQLFREGTAQEFPFDETLWAAVEGQLPSNTATGGLWWFNLNSFALLFILFTCATIPSDTVRPTNKLSATSISTTGSSTQPESTEVKQVTEEQKVNRQQVASIVPSNTIQPNLQTTIKTNTNNKLSNNPNQTFIPLDSGLANTETKPSLANESSNDQTDVLKKVVEKNKTSTSIGKAPKANDRNKTEESNNDDNDIAIEDVDDEVTTIQKAPVVLNDKIKNPATELTVNEISRKSSYPNFNKIDPLSFTNLNDGFQLSLQPIGIAPKKRKVKKNFYYAELEISRSFNIDKKLEGSNEAFINYKKQNEESVEQTNYGLNIYQQKRFFTYGIGVHYSVYTERVNYTLPKEAEGFIRSYDTTYRVVNSNFDSNGTPVILLEQDVTEVLTPTTIIVEDQVVTINTIKRIRVPVFVGIQKSYNNWVGELRTALVANYITEQEGIYIDESLDGFSSISTGEQINSFVLGNKNDLSLGYSLNEFFVIGGRFSYEQDLGSFTKGYNSRLRSNSLGVWLLWKPE